MMFLQHVGRPKDAAAVVGSLYDNNRRINGLSVLVTSHGIYMPTYTHYSLYQGVYQGQAFWCRRKAVRTNFDCVRECTPRAMTVQIFPRPVSFLRYIPFDVRTNTATTESRNITNNNYSLKLTETISFKVHRIATRRRFRHYMLFLIDNFYVPI